MTQLKSPQNKTNNNCSSTEADDELNSRISPWVAKILYFIGCYLVIPFFFGKISITGQKNIPLQDPVIVAPTHRSRWDAFIIPYALGRYVSGRDLRFMVSENEVKGFQGWVIERMGGFPVNTDRPQLNSVRHSIKLLQETPEMLVIFPEGGIYNDNHIHPLKRGVASIALQAETDKSSKRVKILPVSIRYSHPYPRWRTKVKVDIGSPLTVAEYLNGSLRKSSQHLTTALEEKLRRLYDED